MFDLNLLNPGNDLQYRPDRPAPIEADEAPHSVLKPAQQVPESSPFGSLPRVSQSLDFAQKQSLSLELETAEGDRIQLNFSAVDAQSQRIEPGAYQYTSIQASQLQLSIEGNLNKQELDDLNAFLGQVESLADRFYGGDLAGAFSMAQQFDIRGTELASFSLNMQSQTQLRQVEEYRAVEGKPSLAPELMQQMSGYLNDLIDSADLAERISPRKNLLEPVLDWLDQGDKLFSSFNKQFVDELLPDFGAQFRELEG